MRDGHGALALVGGAEWREGCSFDKVLIERSGAEEVLVLPTAAAYEFPERSVAFATDYFATLGVRVRPLMVLSHRDALDERNAAVVEKARFIYLGGGSPLHLRSVLKDTPTWDSLVRAFDSGATVAGSSAGGMVLTDPMVDPRGGAYTLGLGLVRNLAFVPHYSSWSNDRLKRTLMLAGPNMSTVGVDERTALIHWPDGSWEAMGAGKVEVFHMGKAVELSSLNELATFA